MNKKQVRLRRAKRARGVIKRLGVTRLSIHRTLNHIYAQLVTPCGATVLASASTLDKEVRAAGADGLNLKSAAIVGQFIAQRGLAAGIEKVAFDRSGFKFHGRVKALADAAREAGLQF